MFAPGVGAGEGQIISAEDVRQMTSDQVPARARDGRELLPKCWEARGWGFGVGVRTDGPQAWPVRLVGRPGIDFFVDPDGRIGILLTQVELGERMWPMVAEFQALTLK